MKSHTIAGIITNSRGIITVIISNKNIIICLVTWKEIKSSSTFLLMSCINKDKVISKKDLTLFKVMINTSLNKSLLKVVLSQKLRILQGRNPKGKNSKISRFNK
jgi:hypothetical protein